MKSTSFSLPFQRKGGEYSQREDGIYSKKTNKRNDETYRSLLARSESRAAVSDISFEYESGCRRINLSDPNQLLPAGIMSSNQIDPTNRSGLTSRERRQG